MDLRLKDVARLLAVSEKTVYRWIQDGRIPFYRLNRQYRFREDELNSWLSSRRSSPLVKDSGGDPDFAPVPIHTLLERGGIYYRIGGGNMEEILANVVQVLHLPAGIEPPQLLSCLIQREQMMSTALGNGIAIPHPRKPLLKSGKDEQIAVCFLETPGDFNALDGKPVSVLFILLSCSTASHVRHLARLSYLCRQKEFTDALNGQALRQEIIRLAEKALSASTRS